MELLKMKAIRLSEEVQKNGKMEVIIEERITEKLNDEKGPEILSNIDDSRKTDKDSW